MSYMWQQCPEESLSVSEVILLFAYKFVTNKKTHNPLQINPSEASAPIDLSNQWAVSVTQGSSYSPAQLKSSHDHLMIETGQVISGSNMRKYDWVVVLIQVCDQERSDPEFIFT